MSIHTSYEEYFRWLNNARKCRYMYALKLNTRTQDKETGKFKNRGIIISQVIRLQIRSQDQHENQTKHHKQEDHTRPGYYEKNKTKLVSANIDTKQVTMNAVNVKPN